MIVIYKVQEFITKVKSAHPVLFVKVMSNLDFVWMTIQLIENSANAAIV